MGILYGLGVLITGLLFVFGLMSEQTWMIGAGLLGMALCVIYGLQPGHRDSSS